MTEENTAPDFEGLLRLAIKEDPAEPSDVISDRSQTGTAPGEAFVG
jgi:hypothetical protein